MKTIKNLIVVLLALFILTMPVLTQEKTKDKPDLSDIQWNEDIDFMVDFLNKTHPNPYLYISKDEFNNKIIQLKKEISNLNDDEVIVELLKIITSVRDGHTMLHGKSLTDKWFPIRIQRFPDGYFITSISSEYPDFIGSEVIKIGKYPVAEVFKKLKGVAPKENEYSQDYYTPIYLTMNTILSGLHIISSPDSLNLTLLQKGQERELIILSKQYESDEYLSWYWLLNAVPAADYITISDINSDNLPLYLKNSEKPYWFEYLEKNNLLYFGFNECRNDDNEHFNDFNKRMWKFIENNNARFLVIDLRNNFGGTNSILLPLIHEIIKHDEINQKEHLFVITGHKTFSAAMHCATWIEFHCNPTFVGQPTGAPPNHFADPDFSFLPNSRILLMVSKYHWQNTWAWDERDTIEPDITVNIEAVDYFNSQDPIMDKIMEKIIN